MEKIFSTEMNIAEDARENKSKDEVYAEQHFLKHLKFENGRYWTKPIFKSTFVPMLNNYNLCIRRYKNLRRQLSKNPELEEAYKREIHKLLEKDNVEIVEEDPLTASDPKRMLNYLPQVCVTR